MTQITIDRALVEQALGALENLQPIIGNGLLNKIQLAFIDPNLDVAITALRAVLAQQADKPQRPKCFEFALDFLGTPENGELLAYIEQLEARAALAQQAEPVQEPVATVVARQYDDGTYAGNALDWVGRGCENDFPIGTNLYTAPPQRKPLTDEEIVRIFETPELAGTHFQTPTIKAIAVARAIERAHGIKE